MGEEIKDQIIKHLLEKIDDLVEQLDEAKDIRRKREGVLTDVEPNNALLVLPEEPYARATGRTTRLVDKYIQDLFTNRREWVDIRDHIDNKFAHSHLIRRVLDRLNYEHSRFVATEIDRTEQRIKIL